MRDGQPCGGSEPAHTIEEPSNRQLLEGFADRQDASAFATLIRRHGPMVLGVCRRVLNHEQEAEDAFQATFLVLVRKAASIDRPELLGNWLYGVAFRIAQKARSQLARRRHHESLVEPMTTIDPHDDLLWKELRGLLDEELRQLPSKYRVPLVLCYLEGMTNYEAARQLGWPVGSMSHRLARGRQMLRERLRARKKMLSGMFLLVLLQEHANPEEVSAPRIDATLQAAMNMPHPAAAVAPNPVAAEPGVEAAPAASASRPAFWWRRSVLTLLALVATAAVATAGSVIYLKNDGFGNSTAASVAPAASPPMSMPSCH